MTACTLAKPLYWVGERCLANDFPALTTAMDEPNGLLAIGGDLSSARLLDAYSRGIFPWYSDDQPLLWWSPDPRAVLAPSAVKISHSLAKTLRRGGFTVTVDHAFAEVITACAAPRALQSGTWITDEMRAAYLALHGCGYAHSLECWRDDTLCGGLYGVALGRAFFGESMFSRVRDASKVVFVTLCRLLEAWGYGLIDCQMPTAHLARLGASLLPRAEFAAQLTVLTATPPSSTAWRSTTVLP